MTKRDVIKFLERKQQEKTDDIRTKYNAEHDQHIQSIFSEIKLPELADQIQPLMDKARRFYDEWRKKHEKREGVSFNHSYFSLAGQLISCTSSENAVFKDLSRHISLNTKEMDIMIKNYRNNRESVENTFNTVIQSVQQMKSAKQAAIYLRELGFDLSELENPSEQAQTALMVPVDTQFLFVKDAA